ncbi:MAG TPA: pseudouridine synthase [Chloroflexota bacterium]|nr:pseudouridine synthase [Chloroflexota bacterium]
MEQRLQKVLAHAGVASRRAAERLVVEGRVAVNGAVVRTLGTRVDPERDVLTVDGRPVRVDVRPVYVLLHKPRGVVSTARDERGRPTVLDLVRVEQRVYPVGRLDADSEGLLLLTNDGELAYRLTHPRHAVPKEYHVLVRGQVSERALARLRAGVRLPEAQRLDMALRARADAVAVLGREKTGTWLCLVLHQGWKRQIRRMLAAVGYPVERLIRVRIGGLTLGNLPVGHWRVLSPAEVARALERGDAAADYCHRRPRRRREDHGGAEGSRRAGLDVLR